MLIAADAIRNYDLVDVVYGDDKPDEGNAEAFDTEDVPGKEGCDTVY